ncbi:hypothetical protein ABH920_006368 [Catenulispora sp. EB89]|uniref:hypothetical protein n=1 Tax=Catenulispora sp. EB89 TaxID=3156257 RepID=UPI0035158AD0
MVHKIADASLVVARAMWAAVRRAWNWYAASTPAIRYVTGRARPVSRPSRLSTSALDRTSEPCKPDVALLAALVGGGMIGPEAAIVIALVTADRCRNHPDKARGPHF